MTTPDTSRRLPARQLQKDVEALNGLRAIADYTTTRADATPEHLQASYQAMLDAQRQADENHALYQAAVDAARAAEWDFHKAVLAMKDVVRGQFGSDSDAAQAVGLKKKSERRRPRRRQATEV